MSKARRLKKMAKKASQPAFYERLHAGLLEMIAWANDEIPLRVTVMTENSRTIKFCKASELNHHEDSL